MRVLIWKADDPELRRSSELEFRNNFLGPVTKVYTHFKFAVKIFPQRDQNYGDAVDCQLVEVLA